MPRNSLNFAAKACLTTALASSPPTVLYPAVANPSAIPPIPAADENMVGGMAKAAVLARMGS